MSHAWEPSDILALRRMACTMPVLEIADLMHRSVAAIEHKAWKLQISIAFVRQVDRKWTAQEEGQVKALSGTMPIDNIAALLGRSREAIIHRGCVMGVPMGFEREPACRQRLDELRALVAEGLPAPGIARRMGLPLSTVRGRLNRLGLQCQADGRGCPIRPEGWRTKPRQPKPKAEPQRIVRVPVSALAYCNACHAPVINTSEGWAAHQERIRCEGRAA